MNFIRTSLTVLLVLLLWSSGECQNPPEQYGFFSTDATYVYLGKTAISPDGMKVVSVRVLDDNAQDFPTLVTVKTGSRTLTSKVSFGLNAQVLWSTDSRSFAITGSSDGGNGQYHTSAFLLRSDRLVQVPLTRVIESTFGHPMKCGWLESPNVVAVRWLSATRLLVAAQIINHSNCDCFGTFKGYVVNVVNRSVVESYGQLEVKKRYGSALGPWLQDAPDEWARNPKSCYVAANHPELRHSESQSK